MMILFLLFDGEALVWFDKYIWVVIILFITNALQFFFMRRKDASEVTKNDAQAGNLDAETVSSLIGSIKEIQSLYKEAFKTIQEMAKEQKALEDTLEESELKLSDCIKKNIDITECAKVIKEVKLKLVYIEGLIDTLISNDEISEKIKLLISDIHSKIP